MTAFTALSKHVGWSEPTITQFPNREQLHAAIAASDHAQILRWYRFLRSGQTYEEIAINEAIIEAFCNLRTQLERHDVGQAFLPVPEATHP
jgi:hypothetical protein